METLKELPKAELKSFTKVKSDDRHNIQTHVDYLHLLVSLSPKLPSTPAPILHRAIEGPQFRKANCIWFD